MGDYCVYRHTNKANGKVYIGITNDVNRRWRNGNGYTGRQLFGKAIEKYGWDGFEHEILESSLTLEDACALERRYIALHKSNVHRYSNPSYGYNLTDGGDGFYGVDRSGKKNSFYGKHHTEHSKQLIAKAHTGVNNPFYGRKLTDAEVERLNGPKRKAVICLETGMEFESVAAASKYINVSHASISSCCNGKCPTVKGMHFVYRDCPKTIEPKEQRQNRWVICEDTHKLYMSTNAASKETGIGQASIWDCCNSRRKNNIAGGYHWRYATPDEVSSFLSNGGILLITREDA